MLFSTVSVGNSRDSGLNIGLICLDNGRWLRSKAEISFKRQGDGKLARLITDENYEPI